jgi:hypothetical protein
LEQSLERLEGIQSDFNYDAARTYAKLVRDFYSAMKLYLMTQGMPTETPLIDSIQNETLQLPQNVEERLARLLSKHDDYGVTVRNVCRWYLREVCANERGLIQHGPSLYEPLIHILEMGGHFYEHDGALVLSDAATIPFVGR